MPPASDQSPEAEASAEEARPLLGLPNSEPSAAAPLLSPISRSRLQARRYLSQTQSEQDVEGEEDEVPRRTLSTRAKGKWRADPNIPGEVAVEAPMTKSTVGSGTGRGRGVAVIFSNYPDPTSEGGGNLDVWVEEGENVGTVKDQIRHLRPGLLPLSLRLIHSGRLLTDGILLLPWLRSLENRLKRQAGGMGGDVEEVLKEVGLGDGAESKPGTSPSASASATANPGAGNAGDTAREDKVWLHCIVGGRLDEKKDEEGTGAGAGADEEPAAPRRRGFDVLLDAGLSAADVTAMRRQFYESRGEEVPEGLDAGDANDEHARALEEQWIEGDLTAETATTTTEGQYTSILQGLLAGFLWPLLPLFFFRDAPLPNFFDADAQALSALGSDSVADQVVDNSRVGGEMIPGVVWGRRVQLGIVLGTILNIAFGAMRFLN